MKLLSSFDMALLYNLIAVFNSSDPTFNEWLPEHTDQGFSWQPKSVSFVTLNQSSKAIVKVYQSEVVDLGDDTIHAIIVPFTVGSRKEILVESPGGKPNEHMIPIIEGEHTLVFETGFMEELRDSQDYAGRKVILLPTWCKFTFTLNQKTQPKVLRNNLSQGN